MTSKRQPPNDSIVVKYLDEKFKSIDVRLEGLVESDKRQSEQLAKMNDKMGDMSVTLGQQKEQLATHIRRTDMLENDLKPVKSAFDAVLKLAGWFAIVVAILAGVAQVAQWLKSSTPG